MKTKILIVKMNKGKNLQLKNDFEKEGKIWVGRY